jgi:hypothetical protein
MLFHVSEEPNIKRFEPRSSESVSGSIVWAIDADHLRNYLVPRGCPRVTYYAGHNTTSADVEKFLGASPSVIAIESRWLERLQSCRLYCYHLPSATFECIDACAGYFVSRVPVEPLNVEIFNDPIAEILKRGAELRFMPNLWTLNDAVVVSSLRFSIIRMCNAQPREMV